jgi:hypothetical protein
MKWKVKLPGGGEEIIEAELSIMPGGGGLGFMTRLGPEDAKSKYTITRGFALGAWIDVEAIDIEPISSSIDTVPTAKPKTGQFDTSRLAGALDGMVDCSKGDIAKKIQEALGVGNSMSYRIVRQLIEDGKIRKPKKSRAYNVVDPDLNPLIKEILEDNQITLEQYIEDEYK